MKKYNLILPALLILASCGDDKFKDEIPFPDNGDDSNIEEPVVGERNEKYRPQIHFTPAANWMNDPNGMVYANGQWHLYYQYNPYGNDWGFMSWGHAVSPDLIHWEEKSVAMTPNQYGDIFSGSAIVDKDNVAGFGAGAILAFYTASGEHQQQCLAYSTDNGVTYTQYEGNPVIPNTTMPDFRDPKVFYHQESGKYIMALAKGWDYSIDFWGSDNLKNWTKLSDFRIDSGRCNKGQWECPDLIKLPYKGGEKWVLIVSTNPGGPVSGSGTFYFVGDFDGKEFKADSLDYPLWLDTGTDNYAGVTWSNVPDGRTIYIGWMNNWNYAGAVPCSPWRSAMTLPRELTLVEAEGSPVLVSKIVSELDGIAGNWQTADNGICRGGEAYEMVVEIPTSSNCSFTLGNENGENLPISFNAAARRLIVNRGANSGATGFNGGFTFPSIPADIKPGVDNLKLHIYVDSSSVEFLSEDGSIAMTILVFPGEPYDRINGIDNVSYRVLNSIWK